MNTHEVMSRIQANWQLKLLWGAGLIVFFAALYVLPQRFPVFPVMALPPTWIDRAIPFSADSVYLYESLYLLMPIAPWLMKTKEALQRYCLGILLMTTVGAGFFILFPTSCPRPENVQEANALYRCLIRIDHESNAFPSLHVAFAMFHCACCQLVFRNGRRHRLLLLMACWAWAVAISAATLLTKQHVFIDVVGGFILGLGIFVACFLPHLVPGNGAGRQDHV